MKKTLTKFLLFCVFMLCIFIKIPSSVFAADVSYNSADISVVCEEDGTAHINEIWQVEVNAGTEMYLGRENLKDQTISNLKVSADGKEYESIKNWNVKASFEDKAYKCGIVKKETGYELCWGLSSYGARTFNVSYDMKNLVKECSDGSFIDQTFINNLPSSLQAATITIEKNGDRFTRENTKIWAGGGATGEIFVTDGKIQAKLTEPMSKNSNFAILAQFNKGIFSPEVYVDTSFQKLKDEELDGTNYKKREDEERKKLYEYYKENKSKSKSSRSGGFSISYFFVLAFGGLFYIILRIIVLKTRKIENSVTIYKDKFRKEYKNPDYSRELPFDNNIFATYARLKSLKKFGNECSIIGVYLLKWIQNHYVELIKVEVKKFFKTKLEDVIKFKELPEDTEPLEKELFDLMVEASDEEQVLRKKDFKKWCEKNFDTLEKWLKKYNKKGFRDLKEMGVVVEADKKYLGFVKYKEHELSELGIKRTTEMFGFKKYLEDFTIINEREAKEVELWEDYMLYAQLFGIADKVSEQFKNLYPNYLKEKFENDETMNIILINSLTSSYANSAHDVYVSAHYNSAAAASHGFGGSFSGGGFGGSSGGGSSGVR